MIGAFHRCTRLWANIDPIITDIVESWEFSRSSRVPASKASLEATTAQSSSTRYLAWPKGEIGILVPVNLPFPFGGGGLVSEKAGTTAAGKGGLATDDKFGTITNRQAFLRVRVSDLVQFEEESIDRRRGVHGVSSANSHADLKSLAQSLHCVTQALCLLQDIDDLRPD